MRPTLPLCPRALNRHPRPLPDPSPNPNPTPNPNPNPNPHQVPRYLGYLRLLFEAMGSMPKAEVTLTLNLTLTLNHA